MISIDIAERHCSNRLYEWMSGVALFCYGLHVMIAPSALAHTRYAAILLLFRPEVYGSCCFIVGLFRIVSLYKNGWWPVWGPRIRILVSMAALGLFAQIFVALGQWTYAPPSPGMWIYLAFIGAEVMTVRRVVKETHVQRV